LPQAKVRAYYRQQRKLFEAARQVRRDWDAHCAQLSTDGVWDADAEWNKAFPDLAYEPAAAQA
jgi:hypothetical protein